MRSAHGFLNQAVDAAVLDAFQIGNFAPARVPDWIADQSNTSLRRIEGGAQRGLIRSI